MSAWQTSDNTIQFQDLVSDSRYLSHWSENIDKKRGFLGKIVHYFLLNLPSLSQLILVVNVNDYMVMLLLLLCKVFSQAITSKDQPRQSCNQLLLAQPTINITRSDSKIYFSRLFNVSIIITLCILFSNILPLFCSNVLRIIICRFFQFLYNYTKHIL